MAPAERSWNTGDVGAFQSTYIILLRVAFGWG